MRDGSLSFMVNDFIRINGRQFRVDGSINYLNEADHCNWTEYKLVEVANGVVKWLSIDMVYKEYALYTMSSSQVEDSISRYGYKQVDTGIAKVMGTAGNVDADYGDCVRFTEYEDPTEEKIIAIECWEDEVEYSTGYYLDADEIELISSSMQGGGARTNHDLATPSGGKKYINLFMGIIMLGFIVTVMCMFVNKHVNMKKEIDKSIYFTYVTSLTADIDNSQKAQVYKTNLSIEDAAKEILKLAESDVVSVDESAEDGTVAVLTKKYYCLIYKDETKQTLVQVSTRKYVYNSRVNPYRSRVRTAHYYRSYYYTVGYDSDYKRYKGDNAYQDYTDGTVEINSTNRYKVYSDSIRQESNASRVSSGGGTSSGK